MVTRSSSSASSVEAKLADYEMPAGYQLVFSGENETIQDAMGQMVLTASILCSSVSCPL